MPQITIYLPREVAERIKKKAKHLRKTLSVYLTDLAPKDAMASNWPKHFIALYGSTKKLSIAEELKLKKRVPLSQLKERIEFSANYNHKKIRLGK